MPPPSNPPPRKKSPYEQSSSPPPPIEDEPQWGLRLTWAWFGLVTAAGGMLAVWTIARPLWQPA